MDSNQITVSVHTVGQNADQTVPALKKLLQGVAGTDQFTLEPLDGGANNQVARLRVGEDSYLLKLYFQHPNDDRDRLGAEWCFTRLASLNGVNFGPKPIACDPPAQIAIYEFIPGRKLKSSEIDDRAISAAINFYRALQGLRSLLRPAELANASESCFTLNAHLSCVEQRIKRLKSQIAISSILDKEAREFADTELTETAIEILRWTRHKAELLKIDNDAELPKPDRVISPSDFGFHNALASEQGEIRFIDFEYSGWDDPAKLVCDFFCQPERPVPMKYYGEFSQAVANGASNPESELQRMDLLLPVYRLKWCCIMLNDFLAVDRLRRRFAVRKSEEQRKTEQLSKARRALKQIREEYISRRAA